LVTAPTTPVTDGVKLFSNKIAEKQILITKDKHGIESFLQPSFFEKNIQLYKAAGSVNQVTVLGGMTLSATGTATGSVISTTNIYTKSKIIEYLVTVATTTAVAGFRTNNGQYFRGTAGSAGGFFFVCRWGCATGVATATNRACVGLHSNQAAPTDVEPSTILNQLSMGWDAADANIQIMSNSAGGAATKTDLGASFPVPTANRTKVYQIAFYCPAGSNIVYYTAMDIGTGAVASGSLDGSLVKIPTSPSLLGLKGWMSVGGTSSVIGIGLHGAYIETDY